MCENSLRSSDEFGIRMKKFNKNVFCCKSYKIGEDMKHIYHAKTANDMRSRDMKTKRGK